MKDIGEIEKEISELKRECLIKAIILIVGLAIVLTFSGCGKNSTSTTPKPEEKTISITKQRVEVVPVTTTKITTTTYGPDGKPVAPPKPVETPK